MPEENQVPEWARELAEAIVLTIAFESPASMECQHFPAEVTEWDVDLVEIWPAVMEIEEAGPNDGEMVFGIVHTFDLLAAQKIFEDLEGVQFGFEDDGRSTVTFEGKFKGRRVVVVVYFEPELDDDEEVE
jgi:hypothetical protein